MKRTAKSPPTATPARPHSSHRDRILSHLETLPVPLPLEQLDYVVREATEKNLASWELLERFLAAPAGEHRQWSMARRNQQTRFPHDCQPGVVRLVVQRPDDSARSVPETGDGVALARRDNLMFVGKSGLGKSHLFQGIGRASCELGGDRVRYVTSAALLEERTAAAGDGGAGPRGR